MSSRKEERHIRVEGIGAATAMSGTGPVAEGGDLPSMSAQLIVILRGDDCDVYAQMDQDAAKNLRDLVSRYLS